jgi:hypothetical protein
LNGANTGVSGHDNIRTGWHADYQWMTSENHCIGDIVQLRPSLITGRYLAITSTDSGDPKWRAEKLPGWNGKGGMAYSPLLKDTTAFFIRQKDRKTRAGMNGGHLKSRTI